MTVEQIVALTFVTQNAIEIHIVDKKKAERDYTVRLLPSSPVSMWLSIRHSNAWNKQESESMMR